MSEIINKLKVWRQRRQYDRYLFYKYGSIIRDAGLELIK